MLYRFITTACYLCIWLSIIYIEYTFLFRPLRTCTTTRPLRPPSPLRPPPIAAVRPPAPAPAPAISLLSAPTTPSARSIVINLS